MSTDVATLVVAVDSKQLSTGGNELDKFAQKGKSAEQQTDKLTSATRVLSKAYGDIAKAFAAWKIADLVRDSAMMAARFETMGVVMKVAGNNAGYTREQTEKYSKALQEQGISMMQSRDAIVQLATANIDLTKASELARTAQDLAVVGNINSSEAMERMIHGIKSAEIEILRTLGMNVSWEASYKKTAAQIGTTADKLTEQQKVMSRTNAVIQEGIKYQGIYEEAMGTAGKAMTSLTRYWDNLKIKMGEIFLPALSDSVDTLTRALKASNAELDKASKDGTVQNYGKSLALMVEWSTKAALLIGNGFGAAVTYITQLGAAAAAQAKFLWEGNAAAAAGVKEAWKIDRNAGLASASAFSDSVLNSSPPSTQAPKTAAMSEQERIKQGAASRAAAAAEELRLKNAQASKKSVDSEAQSYDRLIKSIREKIAVLKLEGDGQSKLTDGQKEAAKFAENLASGELKLTAAHKQSVTLLLEKQIAMEKQNAEAKAYAEALESIRKSVVTADDATRELNDAQKVLLDLMRSPEWQGMPDVWKETAIQATATATAELKVLEIRKEMDDLIANTDTAKLEKQREQMQRIADAYLDNKFGIKGSEEAIKQYAEVVDVALGRNATSLEKEADALDEFTKSAAQNMQKALAEFLFDPFADGTKGMLQNFGTMVKQMISQAVSADLMKRLFGDMGKTGDIGGLVGKLLGGFGGGGADSAIGAAGNAAAIANGFETLDHANLAASVVDSFAVGTDYVPRDMIAQIHKGEKIVPAAENKQGDNSNSKGNVYNMTVNVPSGSPSETRRAAGIGAREALSAFAAIKRYA
jgi:hypothetical protein